MPQFRYVYRAAKGDLAEGTIEAETPEEAVLLLRSRGIFPQAVMPERKRRGVRPLGADTLSAFFRQLKALLRTGQINVPEALRLLEEQVPPRLRPLYAAAAQKTLAGESLSQALASTGLFPPLAISLLQVGEASGKIEESMELIQRYYARAGAFARKVRKALTYPAMVLLIAFGVTWGLMVFIVPQFASLLKEFGSDLPLLTRVVMSLSAVMSSPLGIAAFVASVGGAVYLGRSVLSNEELRKSLEPRALKLPLIGPILRYGTLSTLGHTLAVMYQAGIQIHEALDYVRKALPLVVYREAVGESRKAVTFGRNLSSTWALFPELFPPLFLSLVRIGEETGQLDEMLEHGANFYEEEAESLLDGAASVIEPALLVLVGGIIALVMLSILLPYFRLAQSIGGF